MKKILAAVVLAIIIAIGLLIAHPRKASTPPSENTSQSTNQAEAPSNSFDKKQFSTSDPTSIWVIANKSHGVNPVDYVPTDLITPSVALRLETSAEQMHIRKQVEKPMQDLFNAAKAAGFQLSLGSGYRSYSYQKTLYNGYIASMGQAGADGQSARPGHSEHQTGLAFDVEITGMKCHLEQCLGDTADGQWIAANAYKYGFIIRYPKGKEDITGYEYEPWHLRYVGVDLATEMHNQNIQTLEEFFSVSGGRQY